MRALPRSRRPDPVPGLDLPLLDEGWQNDLLLLHTEREDEPYAGGDDALAEQLLQEEAELAAADR